MQTTQTTQNTIGSLDPSHVSITENLMRASRDDLHSQALVNVPALSERTLRRDIEKGGFSTGSEIQVYM